MTAPVVRHTWALRGHTPEVASWGGPHRKVSVIGALWVAPDRGTVRLGFQLHPNANLNGARIVDFVRQQRAQRKGPMQVIWDRLSAHRGVKVRRYQAAHPEVEADCLPPYAPELNPIEYVWGYVKRNLLANRGFLGVEELTKAARRAIRSLQRQPGLLRSFILHSDLPLDIC